MREALPVIALGAGEDRECGRHQESGHRNQHFDDAEGDGEVSGLHGGRDERHDDHRHAEISRAEGDRDAEDEHFAQ